MNELSKEEILKKAQNENKGRDLAENEAQKRDLSVAVIVAYIVATFLCIVQIAAGKGINFGMYIVINTVSSFLYVSRARRNPIWQNVCSAISFSLSTVLFCIGFIIYLFR